MARNGGRLVVECLQALGARRAFGVPGESYLAVLDALHDSEIGFVNCRQEGGAAFMAAAHGKLTGSPGICLVTRGPGATNASIGVHTAMQDSAPMILLVGQIATWMREREAFQEVDYRAVFGTMAKWVTEIDDVDRVPELLSRAWTVATTGRPGPVVVALPEDILMAATDATPVEGPVPIFPPEPAPAAVAEALEMIGRAERPLILFGGAPWDRAASAALQRFAEASDIPVASSFRYQDQFDSASPCFCGDAGVGMTAATKALLRDADVILALGIRFGENMTDGYALLDVPDPVQKIIHVHASDRELGKVYRPALGIHAAPERFALALGETVQGSWGDWRAAARDAYLGFIDKAPAQPGPVDMVAVCAHLRDRLEGEELVLTNGAGNFTVWPSRFFRFRPGMRLLAPQSGSMGYGLPAAVAAKLERPGATVICFAGDGDIQMTMQELATARQAGAAVIVIVVNNGTYGTIRAHQEREFPTRVSGTDLVNPDFATLAQGYGLHGERVEETAAFADAFERALAAPHGALLELTVTKEALTPYRTLTQIREGR
ncbi:MAG: thiamine pyrophosphate-binding protein [Rhodobacteraceae bacterium]|jgi:acetolactate synthase-1/2/3 large subunit|uniref:Acetolactate synthase-1/2/3 large subunit n=1 Tax=Salipiger profundus TaxID=1229727 RepID=A0A1U7D0H2_9RHOB|nr:MULTISPECIES: thiamine pyrophosphate-dependent enzyme [Salipiger]APX21641.1 acetolactate synthase-1/2/3 large subunit [Salipiger profundus]MAB08317.1 thiamine pyrophosphate-binding protein [Paracoccaceae bacterium]GGA00958.1 thiamine pyrophosphate TPP-binding domain-containing protein [Salipiger profundus]SFC12218.1 acetolactate synthase-1/2/3 large subunit [Salipiger profundus]